MSKDRGEWIGWRRGADDEGMGEGVGVKDCGKVVSTTSRVLGSGRAGARASQWSDDDGVGGT